MELQIPVCLVMLSVVTVTSVIAEGMKFSLNPRHSKNEFTSCVTKTGVDGKCVHWSYCSYNNYEIETGGNIDDSELRSLECVKPVEWCCSDKNVTKPSLPKPREVDSNSTCIVSERPVCPWCVKLFRDGNDRRRRESGFFCMGTLIGTRVILTTGTCMIQAHSQNVWAQVPSSAKPTANYTVKFRVIHPKYNSGTRENDLALFTMDAEVEWDKSGPLGACLGLESSSLEGDCIGAGIDDDENIEMTPLLVAKGNCGRGSKTDAACGHAIGEDCSIVPGSPIMCRVNKASFIMSGLAKLPCIDEPPKSLLNNLVQASNWLTGHLKGTMALTEIDYLKLNK